MTGPLTAEEFLELPCVGGQRQELVQGEVRSTAPAGFDHGLVSAAVMAHLRDFAGRAGLGVVLSSETGFTIGRDPDTVRAPDAAFVRSDRVPPPGARGGFAEFAPDLVVEVNSPWDRAAEVLSKALAWLDAGVRVVWVLDPESHSVTVYTPDGVARIVRGAGAVLGGGEVLPGLALPLADLFGD